MQNSRWLRYGLASLTLCGAGISALVVACSSDTTDNGDTTTDSGTNTNPDGSTTGDGGTTDGAAAVVPAKLQLVNAATSLGANDVGALRVCFEVGPSKDQLVWATLPPIPNRNAAPGTLPFPGVFIGTGGAVPSTGVDLTSLVLRPYLVSAQALAVKSNLGNNITAGNDQLCGDIFGDADAGGSLVAGEDYWVLPDIAPGTLNAGKSYILALTGCSGNTNLTAAQCGADLSTATGDNGNLKINVFEADTTTVDTAKLGAQFANASPNLVGVLSQLSGGSLKVVPAFQSNANEPNTAILLDGGVDSTTGGFGVTTKLDQVAVTVATDSFTVQPDTAKFAISLPQIQLLTYGAATSANAYALGSSYTFIALGDPTAETEVNGELPDGGDAGLEFNFKSFHYLGLPNNPTIAPFDPSK